MTGPKYYQPSIEEFHVGFEFEFYEGCDDNGEVYEKRVFHEHEEPYYYKDSDSVRVKHLDREDIESFGFEYIGNEGADLYWTFNKGGVKMFYNPPIYPAEISHLNHQLTILNSDGPIHLSNPKNKSELKRILNQLGI